MTTGTGIGRRNVLAFVGAAAAAQYGAARLVMAQSQTGPTASAQAPAKPTVTLERLPMGVLLIGIDRVDEQNRIDIPTFTALGQAYYEFEHDDGLRVAVVYGNGPDFSQGLDLASWGAGLRGGPFRSPPKFIDPLGTGGLERSKPMVVAVQGHVTRIGHELFLAADIRVAAQDSVFNQGEVVAASFPAGGATIRFAREAGWGNAMRYMLTGANWCARDAYRMGLVQEVTPPGKQLDRATDLAKQIAAAAPLGVRATLASARRSLSESENLALATLQTEFGRLLRSEDRQEYLHALQEKRTPVYVGR